MQMCGPSQAGPSLEPRWLSQTRSHHLLEDDTNPSYLYWKDLPGRGEPDTEGAWRAGRRGRQLPAPSASLPAPAPPRPLRDWSHWEVTGWRGPSPRWRRSLPRCPLGNPAPWGAQGGVPIPTWDT